MHARHTLRLAAVAVLVVASSLMLGGTAEAKGKPANVTLSCSAAVGSASATVTLYSSAISAPVSNPLTLDCGSGSVSGLSTNTGTVKGFAVPVGVVSYSIIQSSPAAGGCAGTSTRPLSTTCNVGITLTVS